MHPGFEQGHPHYRPDKDIHAYFFLATAVHQQKDQDAAGHDGQGKQGNSLGIEERDDQDCADIVKDGQGSQQHLQANRHARAQERQDAQSEGDIGGRRDCPAAQGNGIAKVEGGIDERRDQHAAQRSHRRQDDAASFL
ncbi:MAG: hypothetical protein ACD_75C00448G0002 [uncultured bacterium]|nr:MAG: hypothetical protein ACD_75C00448G0002 [uncultured bacterium]